MAFRDVVALARELDLAAPHDDELVHAARVALREEGLALGHERALRAIHDLGREAGHALREIPAALVWEPVSEAGFLVNTPRQSNAG